MLTDIHLKIDDSILLSLKAGKEAFTKEMLFHHALMLYRQNRLSLGKAAELAGYDRLDFIRQLQAVEEPIFDYELDLVEAMIEAAQHSLSIIAVAV